MSDHSNISKLDATPGMALLDCVPVLFFWAMISLIGSLWSFPLYWVALYSWASLEPPRRFGRS